MSIMHVTQKERIDFLTDNFLNLLSAIKNAISGKVQSKCGTSKCQFIAKICVTFYLYPSLFISMHLIFFAYWL